MIKPSKKDGATNLGTEMLMRKNAKLPPQDHTSSIAQQSNTKSSIDGHTVAKEKDKAERWEMVSPMIKKAVTFEVTTQPLAQPIKLAPKEWHALHDDWLNSTMRAEMEDDDLQGIPTMTGYCEGKRSMMTTKNWQWSPLVGLLSNMTFRLKRQHERIQWKVHKKHWQHGSQKSKRLIKMPLSTLGQCHYLPLDFGGSEKQGKMSGKTK